MTTQRDTYTRTDRATLPIATVLAILAMVLVLWLGQMVAGAVSQLGTAGDAISQADTYKQED